MLVLCLKVVFFYFVKNILKVPHSHFSGIFFFIWLPSKDIFMEKIYNLTKGMSKQGQPRLPGWLLAALPRFRNAIIPLITEYRRWADSMPTMYHKIRCPVGTGPFEQHLFNIVCQCCLNINFWYKIRELSFFTERGGASVCDHGSSICSGPKWGDREIPPPLYRGIAKIAR